jgi:hypothetical protein
MGGIMSRLDRHVSTVRTKMTIGLWLSTLAWAGIYFAIVVWAAILIDKLVQVHLPRQMIWFWCGLGATVVGSLAFAIRRRPSAKQAAVAIDEKLALKEKFSTALYIRPSKDPFAMAAVKDAERTADNVSLHKQFPVQVPKASGGTAVAALAALCTLMWVPQFDLLGVQAAHLKAQQVAAEQDKQAREVVKRAIKEIAATPQTIANKEEIRMAMNELKAMQERPTIDPEKAKATAEKALQDVKNAVQERIQQNQNFAISKQEMNEFKNLMPPTSEDGPVADANRAMAQGKFDEAVEDLSKAVNNFEKMSQKDKEKAAQQMQNLAKAIDKLANDPKVQEQMQKQLQQMGATQQQAEQMTKLMQQAANGDKQAQQQVQQMTKQLTQQQNVQGNKPAQQQRQVAQQMQQQIQQMQQQANQQAAAQQLAQSSQALSQAMQQSAQGGSQGQPKQGNNSKTANNGANQQNQPGGQQGNQNVANAGKQMQQQLQQMQAIANDAQQVAAGNGGQPGNGGQDDGGNPGAGNQQGGQGGGQWGKNPPNQQGGNGNGGGAGGIGAGNNRPAPEVAPFSVKNETDLSQKNEKGRTLASTFVKAGSIKGEAKLDPKIVIPSVDKQATDEVDEQRIPRQDQDAVRGYFGNLKRDAAK